MSQNIILGCNLIEEHFGATVSVGFPILISRERRVANTSKLVLVKQCLRKSASELLAIR